MRVLPWLGVLSLLAIALTSCGGQRADSETEDDAIDLGKIAFERVGAIYVKALPDGEPYLVADGTSPRWSPSGEWLLFESEEASWVLREDDTSLRELDVGWAVWAPESDKLAFVTGQNVLVVENADGSESRVLTTSANPVVAFAWSPDEKSLAYVEERSDQKTATGESPFPHRESILRLVAIDGQAPSELYRSAEDALSLAGWTADGSYILFWRDIQFSASLMADGTTLEAVPVTGGEPRPLASGLTLDEMWSPAPTGGLLAITEGVGRETWSNKRIAVVDVERGKVTELTEASAASLQPAWSPDGNRIAFTAQPENEEGFASGKTMPELSRERRIWVMNADGSDRHPLTDDPAYRDERPQWSTDGSQVLFARLDSEMRGSLWLVPAHGGAPQQVIDSLGPAVVFDYYGSVSWDRLFDWWQP